MLPVLIPAIASVVVVILTILGQRLNSRNDRALALQEVDLLSKLNDLDETFAAEQLKSLILRRTVRWNSKFRDVGQQLPFRLAVGSCIILLLLASARFSLAGEPVELLKIARVIIDSASVGAAATLFVSLGFQFLEYFQFFKRWRKGRPPRGT